MQRIGLSFARSGVGPGRSRPGGSPTLTMRQDMTVRVKHMLTKPTLTLQSSGSWPRGVLACGWHAEPEGSSGRSPLPSASRGDPRGVGKLLGKGAVPQARGGGSRESICRRPRSLALDVFQALHKGSLPPLLDFPHVKEARQKAVESRTTQAFPRPRPDSIPLV